MKCEDCGVVVNLESNHWEEHEGFCCDCFDELFGKPPYKRSVLRESADPQTVADHIKYWKSIEDKKKKRELDKN